MIWQNTFDASIGRHKVRPSTTACAWMTLVYDIEVMSVHYTALFGQRTQCIIHEYTRSEPDGLGMHVIVAQEVVTARGLLRVFFEINKLSRMPPRGFPR
jgi:hypothetical protein